MNTQNFASLEASKKLHDAGIILETDYKWFCRNNTWKLVDICYYLPLGAPHIPAPCFTEVWRELPDGITIKKWDGKLVIIDDDGTNFNLNPTDALIDLLIWLRGEGNDHRRQ